MLSASTSGRRTPRRSCPAPACSATSGKGGQPERSEQFDQTRPAVPPKLLPAMHMTRTQRLLVVLLLTLALVAGLIAAGIAARSLAVLAEGGDYLLDAAGVCVALFAIRLSRRSARDAVPAGRRNATNVAALINAGWLLILELLVA